MGKRGFERFFRLKELVALEKIKQARKKKPRWANCFLGEVPALSNGQQTKDWVRQLKTLLHDQSIM